MHGRFWHHLHLHCRCALLVTALSVEMFPLQVALQPAAEGSAESFSAASGRLMTAVAAAWAAQGFSEQELVNTAIARSKGMPEAARASLLQGLSAALPSVASLGHHVPCLSCDKIKTTP